MSDFETLFATRRIANLTSQRNSKCGTYLVPDPLQDFFVGIAKIVTWWTLIGSQRL